MHATRDIPHGRQNFDEGEEYDEDSYEEEEEESDRDDEHEENEVVDVTDSQRNNQDPSHEQKSFRKMLKTIFEFYPHAKSQFPPSPPRQLLHEERFEALVNDKKKTPEPLGLRLYDRVDRVRSDAARKVSRSVKDKKKIALLLQKRRRSVRVAEDESFNAPPSLNEEFERLTGEIPSYKKFVSIPLGELVQMENLLLSIQENQSLAMWIICTLFS